MREKLVFGKQSEFVQLKMKLLQKRLVFIYHHGQALQPEEGTGKPLLWPRFLALTRLRCAHALPPLLPFSLTLLLSRGGAAHTACNIFKASDLGRGRPLNGISD